MKIISAGHYIDGFEGETTLDIPDFPGDATDDDAVRDYLWEYTGGVGAPDPSLDALYQITIVECPWPHLINAQYEWLP